MWPDSVRSDGDDLDRAGFCVSLAGSERHAQLLGGREAIIISEGRGRPIFILGCPRSGTTLLSLMLHQHPRIAIPPENRFLMPVYLKRERFGDLAVEANRRALAEMIVTSKWFGDLGLDPSTITDRIVDEAWTVGSAVGLVLRAYSDRFGKLRWGDKRPYYRTAIWLIRRMFPNAQFVHIIRDGRDCVASMKSVPPWDELGFSARVRAWTEAIDRGNRARDDLPADTYHEIQYEMLVADPEKHLSTLSEFLGEPYDEAMLSPERLADTFVPEHQTWHVRTRQEVSTRSVGSFRDRLEPWQLRVCEAVMGERLREYGYELTGAGPPAPEELEDFFTYTRKQARRVRRRRRRDRTVSYPWPVADMSVREAQLHRQASALRNEVASLVSQRDDLQKRLTKVTESRSWQLTAPLRAAHPKRLTSAARNRRPWGSGGSTGPR
ncbi:sulfotransferase [Actinopolymorpha sp. B17G11]|uniref:sulfotransferase family protein n=1 Tax=Actinopolymorpha sp. B17G11 TaxID=3160861 RepID=UPI0032E39110